MGNKTVWAYRKLLWSRGDWGLSVALPRVAVVWPWRCEWCAGYRARVLRGESPGPVLFYRWSLGPFRVTRVRGDVSREEGRRGFAGFERVGG